MQTDQERITAVVLAAGQAKRMGQPKQLLPWGQRTVLGQTLHNLQQTAVNDIVVVTGHHATAVTAIAINMGIKPVYNPDYATGEMLSSLQIGLLLLPVDVTAVLVMLADQPMILPNTIDELLTTYKTTSTHLLAPTYNGRRGNPVIIGRHHFVELQALPHGDAPRTLLKRHRHTVHHHPVTTPTILQDLDTMAVYEQLRP